MGRKNKRGEEKDGKMMGRRRKMGLGEEREEGKGRREERKGIDQRKRRV